MTCRINIAEDMYQLQLLMSAYFSNTFVYLLLAILTKNSKNIPQTLA